MATDNLLFSTLILTAATGLILAAASDFKSYRIPNRLCLAIAAAYGAAILTLPLPAWLVGLGVGTAVFALGALLFARGVLGGGDVKLAAAAALWAGVDQLSAFTFVTAVSGLALSGIMLSPLRRWMPRPPGGAALVGAAQPMPFGVPIAAGGLAVLYLRVIPLV